MRLQRMVVATAQSALQIIFFKVIAYIPKWYSRSVISLYKIEMKPSAQRLIIIIGGNCEVKRNTFLMTS